MCPNHLHQRSSSEEQVHIDDAEIATVEQYAPMVNIGMAMSPPPPFSHPNQQGANGPDFARTLLLNLTLQLKKQLELYVSDIANSHLEHLNQKVGELNNLVTRLQTQLTQGGAANMSLLLEDINKLLQQLPDNSTVRKLKSGFSMAEEWFPLLITFYEADWSNPEQVFTRLLSLHRRPALLNDMIELAEGFKAKLQQGMKVITTLEEGGQKLRAFVTDWEKMNAAARLSAFLILLNDEDIRPFIASYLPAELSDALQITRFFHAEFAGPLAEESLLHGGIQILNHLNSEGFQTRLAEQEIAGIKLQPLVQTIKSATYPRQEQAAVLKVFLNLINKDQSWWDFFSASSTELLQIPAAQNAGIGLLNLLGIESMSYMKAIKTLLDGGLNQSYQPADLLNLLHKDINRGIDGKLEDSGLIQLVGLFLNIDLNSLSNLKVSLTAINKQTSWKGYLVAVIEALKAIPAVQVRLGRLTQFADWVIWLFDGLAPIYRLWRTWKEDHERGMHALINEMKQSSNELLSGIGYLSPWLPLLRQMRKAGVGLPPIGTGNIGMWLESVTRLLLTHSSLEHLRGKAENIAGEWVGERMVQIFTAALDQTLQQQPLLINTTPVTQAVRTAMQWAIDLYPLVESQISGMLLQPPGSQKKPPKLSSLLPAMYFVPPEEKVANAQMMFPVSQDQDEEYQGEDTDWAWWTKTFGIASLLLFAGSATASRLANSRDKKRGTSDIENPMELQPLENKQPKSERIEQQPEQVERLPKEVNKTNKWAWGLGLLGGVSAVAAIGSGMMWYYSSPPIEETEEYFYTDDI